LLAAYRSAISEIHDPIDGVKIGQHPDISKAMHAVRLENPPSYKNDDPIDITPSLEYITNLGEW
jgi:hypothetical protein